MNNNEGSWFDLALISSIELPRRVIGYPDHLIEREIARCRSALERDNGVLAGTTTPEFGSLVSAPGFWQERINVLQSALKGQ